MGYQDEREGDVGKEMAWLVGGKDISGQAEQELGKAHGGKNSWEFGRKTGQEVGT